MYEKSVVSFNTIKIGNIRYLSLKLSCCQAKFLPFLQKYSAPLSKAIDLLDLNLQTDE